MQALNGVEVVVCPRRPLFGLLVSKGGEYALFVIKRTEKQEAMTYKSSS